MNTHGLRILGALALFLALAMGLSAQNPADLTMPFARAYGSDKGLPGPSATSLAWDTSGRLWAGSQGGLAWLDGQRWVPLALPGPTGNVRSICATGPDTLWVGTENMGLFRYHQGQWRGYLDDFRINAICLVQGTLWAATHGKGIWRLDGDAWKQAGLDGRVVWQIQELPGPDGRTRLWACTDRGLWALGPTAWEAVLGEVGELNALVALPEGQGRYRLWFSTWNKGLGYWDGRQVGWETPLGHSIPFTTALHADQDSQGRPRLWVGTYDRGIYWLEAGRWRRLARTNGPGITRVYQFLAGRGPHPTLWCATRGAGAVALDADGWRQLDPAHLPPTGFGGWVGGTSRDLFLSAPDSLWRFSQGRFRREPGPAAPTARLNALLATPDPEDPDHVWAAGLTGVFERVRGRWKHHLLGLKASSRGAICLLETRFEGGRQVWVGGQQGLFRFEGGAWFREAADPFHPRDVYSLAAHSPPGRPPELWVGTRNLGVLVRRGGEWAKAPLPGTHERLTCNDLLRTEDAQGRGWLWACFPGVGLGRLALDAPGTAWKVWPVGAFVPQSRQAVLTVRPAGRNRLVLGLAMGVVLLSLDVTPEGPEPRVVGSFTSGDGLPAGSLEERSCFVDPEERIWVASTEGVGMLDLRNLRPGADPPLPQLDRVDLRKATVAPHHGLQVSHGESGFRLAWTLPLYHRREDALFRSQLVGLESEPGPWRPEAQREFLGLPPGGYELKIWARDHAQQESGPVSWSFRVLPPPWRTWWAYVIYATSAGLLVWAAVHWRLRSLQADKARLEREVAAALEAQAEKQRALQESEERYALAAEGANEAIWDAQLERNRVFVSEKFWNLLGQEASSRELSVEEWEALIHPEDLPRMKAALIAHFKLRTPFGVEFRMHVASGGWRWFWSRGQAMWGPDGRATRMGGSLGDITDRKRAEEQLLQAKQAAEAQNLELEELDATVKAINREMDLEPLMKELLVQVAARFPQVQRGMFMLRDETDQCFHTRAALSSRPEIVAASMRFTLPAHAAEAWFESRPDDQARGVHLVQEIHRLPGFKQMSFPPKCLLIMPIEFRGSLEGIFALHNDEDPKAFEATDLQRLLRFREHIVSAVGKAQSLQRLDQSVRQLADAMQLADSARIIAEFEREDAREARALAEQASQAKTAFLANMSHEIRTPMNAILGFAELLRRDANLTPTQRDNLAIIQRSGDALLDLINGILDLSKIEAGRMQLHEGPFGLAGLLQGLEELFLLKAQEKGLACACRCEPGCPDAVVGDEGKLRQVLINLLGNALKFTAQGTVSLRVAQADDRLAFEVADTGVGIAPEEQGLLFASFSQTQSGRASKQGTGLGLALSSQLVRLMGGELTVESDVGAGSTFRFGLPLRVAEAVPPAPREEGAAVRSLAPGQGPWTLLVADDMAESRAVLARFLDLWGFKVLEVANGQEAVKAWEAHHPDLIFMDMRMPVMNGREATQRIKALSGGQALVVAQSASAFEEELDSFLQAGCNRSLRKPLRIPEVAQVLEDLLGARFLREEATEAALPLAAPVAALSETTRVDLRQAVLEGDLDRVRALADGLAPSDPALGERLRALADAFDLVALGTLTEEE